jgi:hypothetical protein
VNNNGADIGTRPRTKAVESTEMTQFRTRKARLRPGSVEGNFLARGDVIELRIDGLRADVTPATIRRFCSAFGHVSDVQILSNSKDKYCAFIELSEPEHYKPQIWIGHLSPLNCDGWQIHVIPDESETEKSWSSWINEK